MMPRAASAFHQPVAIEHCMDGAFGGELDTGESPRQALSDLASTPAGMLVLDVENVVLHLKRESIGIPIRTPAPVSQPLNSTFLVAIEDLIPRLTGDSEFPAEFRHRLAGQSTRHKLKPFVHHRTLLPRHPHFLPKRRKCNPCVRYDVLPMCRVAHGLCATPPEPRRRFPRSR